MTFIRGKLAELRILEESDDEARRWTEHVMAGLDHLRHLFTGSLPARWIDVKAKWRKERESGDVLFGIWANDEFIGTCGLHSHRELYRSWEARWLIFDPDCIGKGIGTEAVKMLTHYAFDRLNAHRVWLGVSAENVGAVRCYEKAGYNREGELRDEIFVHGRYVNAIRMSVLEQEWTRTRQ